MKTHYAIATLTALGLGLCATTASATYVEQFPPSLCVPQAGSPAVSVNSDGQASSSAFSLWFCPVIRDSNNPFSGTSTTLVVNGLSTGTGSIIVDDCRASSTGGSLTCGPIVSTQVSTGTGVVSLLWHPGSEWQSSLFLDSFYVTVEISGGTPLFGYLALD
jgi:hypothetical protein